MKELVGENKRVQLWKAKDQLAEGAMVLLKILIPEENAPEEGIELLKHEYARSLPLSHPHLLNVEHFDFAEGHAYLVMPYFSSKTLRNLLEERITFSERQLALLMRQIGSALEALHQQESLGRHHELLPENIVVARPDYFLLAHLLTATSEDTPTETEESGFSAYQAPEQQHMLEEQDSSSDIFSLGVILYECCTHSLPFPSTGGAERVSQNGLPTLPGQYSAELNELIHACLSPEKSRRPGAKELRQRAEAFLKNGDWHPIEGGEERSSSVKKGLFISLAAAVVLLLIISAFWAYKTDDLPFPVADKEKLATSADQPEDLDAMLIATLEDELEQMNEKVAELEAENRLLRGEEVPNSILMKNAGPYGEEEHAATENKEVAEANTISENKAVPKRPAEKEDFFSANELQALLNRLSNPAFPQKSREDLKERLANRFAEGSIRILEETGGTQNQYSASIFLNLLYKVPHTIVVEEVKINENEKITEIRLEMQTRE